MAEYGKIYGDKVHLANVDGPCDNRKGTVSAEIRDLHEQLQLLDSVTGKLRHVLAPIIVDRPCPAECHQGEIATSRSDIAGQVNAAVNLAFNITSKVNEILRGIDL